MSSNSNCSTMRLVLSLSFYRSLHQVWRSLRATTAARTSQRRHVHHQLSLQMMTLAQIMHKQHASKTALNPCRQKNALIPIAGGLPSLLKQIVTPHGSLGNQFMPKLLLLLMCLIMINHLIPQMVTPLLPKSKILHPPMMLLILWITHKHRARTKALHPCPLRGAPNMFSGGLPV